MRIPRRDYAHLYGPTLGDRVGGGDDLGEGEADGTGAVFDVNRNRLAHGVPGRPPRALPRPRVQVHLQGVTVGPVEGGEDVQEGLGRVLSRRELGRILQRISENGHNLIPQKGKLWSGLSVK